MISMHASTQGRAVSGGRERDSSSHTLRRTGLALPIQGRAHSPNDSISADPDYFALAHGLHRQRLNDAADNIDVGDECTVRTGSTVSLHHYHRPTSRDSDRLPHAFSIGGDVWAESNNDLTTPPRSPQRDNWPLPVSPKTAFPPGPHSRSPVSPLQEDADHGSISEQHAWLSDSISEDSDLITPREQVSVKSVPQTSASSTDDVSWPLTPPNISTPSHVSTSPQSMGALSLPTSPPARATYSIFPRSFSAAESVAQLSTQALKPYRDQWDNRSAVSSVSGFDEPHPGTRIDPASIDESCHTHGTRPETSLSGSSRSFNDFAPSRKIPLPVNFKVTSIDDYFPKFSNHFAGFCKCAWRLQTTQTEKAFVLRPILPKGATTKEARRNSKVTTLKCKKCSFEGPLAEGIPTSASSQIAPMLEYATRLERSPHSAQGITYNWKFLFKSHVPSKTVLKKDEVMDPHKETFACLFCCALGNGTLCFDGAHALCGHIGRHHPDGVPVGQGQRELGLRLLVLVGRAPRSSEEWDIILPGKKQAAFEKERAFSH